METESRLLEAGGERGIRPYSLKGMEFLLGVLKLFWNLN